MVPNHSSPIYTALNTLKGPYFCIGKAVAYTQMRIALARLLLSFEFELPEDFDPLAFHFGVRNMRMTLLEKKLYIKITRRHGVDLKATMKTVA